MTTKSALLLATSVACLLGTWYAWSHENPNWVFSAAGGFLFTVAAWNHRNDVQPPLVVPVVPVARITFPETQLAGFSLLAKNPRISAEDNRGFRDVTFERILGPKPAVDAFFAQYGDVTKSRDNTLRVKEEDGPTSEFDYATLTSIGATVSDGNMTCLDNVTLIARDHPPEATA